MEEKKVLSDVADTILDKPVTFSVDIINKTWFDKLLIKLKLKKSKRDFQITGSTLGTMIKISKELLKIELSGIDIKNILEVNYSLINKHGYSMATIIAYAIQNNKNDPPKKLIDFLVNNLTSFELKNLFDVVLMKMDILNFLHTIIAAKGMTVMNPKDQGSQIASGAPLEAQ